MRKKLLALLLCTAVVFTGCGKGKKKKDAEPIPTDSYGQLIINKTMTSTDKLPTRVFFYDSYFDIKSYEIYEEKGSGNNYIDIIKVICSFDKFSNTDCIDFIKSDSGCSVMLSNLKTDNDYNSYETIYSEYSDEKKEWYFLLANVQDSKDEFSEYEIVEQNKKACDYKTISIEMSFYKDKKLYMTNCLLDNTEVTKPMESMSDIDDDLENDYGNFYTSLDSVYDGTSFLEDLTVINGYYLDGTSISDKR